MVATGEKNIVYSIGPFSNQTFYTLISESTVDVVLVYSFSYENRLQTFMSKRISEVDAVEYIYCQRENDIYLVWIIINDLNPEARRAIYKKQRDIIDLFPDETFDFYVVARQGKSPEAMINQRGVELIYPPLNSLE